MFSRLGPGLLTAFGPALHTPVGRVRWAGTETAAITHGGIDRITHQPGLAKTFHL